MCVAYIDYKRAFESVSISKLLLKLRSYGISGQLLSWIDCFLNNRTQQTRVGTSLYTTTSLTSGVVQGSVIGPLLFILYINDIASLFDDKVCVCKLYADDVKLYTVLQTNVDYDTLQNKLNQLFEWSERWQLSISLNKCNIMYVGNTDCKLNMSLNSKTLPLVNEVKDLGVIVDSHLTFHSPIDKINCCTCIYSLQLNSQMFCITRRLYYNESIYGLCSPHIGLCFVRLVSLSIGAD